MAGWRVWKVEPLARSLNRQMVRVLDATRVAAEEIVLDAILERRTWYLEDGCGITLHQPRPDDELLQERTVATGIRAVADCNLPVGATPANPDVQKNLILRGYLEAALRA